MSEKTLADINNMVIKFQLTHKDTTSLKIINLCYRLLMSNPFNSLQDLWKAIYYLTDEDYINERHAIIFFVERMV